ncbi:BTB/POZ protein [Tricladium varicosporioides]|nr:BTB/POZ protein [Hymenoscyphus varicosporioides]
MWSKSSTPPGLTRLMDSDKYSDLKLVCQGQEFKVHKAIVCIQSPVLAAACDSGFQEATTNVVNIDEFDARTVRRMVEFMYTKEYNDRVEQVSENTGAEYQGSSSLLASTPTTTEILLCHVHMNAIADYYDIPQLKQLANTKIQPLLENTWSPDNFSDIVREVFNSTSDTALRKIMASTAATHMEELVELEDFATLDAMSEFAISIIRTIIAAYKDREDLSTQKLQAVQSQLQQTKSRLQSAEQDCSDEKSLRDRATTRADHIIENVDNCIEILSKTRTCRNPRCEADFTCYIERGGFIDEPKYTLRCARCRCRHKDSWNLRGL